MCDMSASPPKPIRVLVTAFGAFPGAPVNPTLAIVAQLERNYRARLRRLGIELLISVLPVVYGDIDGRVRCLIESRKPDLVLHLGFAGRRRMITVETRGRNRRSILRGGADRRAPETPHISPGREAFRNVRLPTAAIARAMSAAGAPAQRSIDAGDYVCNETLFATLGLFGDAGFVHVPRARAPRQRAGGSRNEMRPTIDAMTRGVFGAIVLIAGRKRSRHIAAQLIAVPNGGVDRPPLVS